MAKRKRVQLLRHRFASRGCVFLDLDCICRHFRAVALGALLKEAPLWSWVEAVFLRLYPHKSFLFSLRDDPTGKAMGCF